MVPPYSDKISRVPSYSRNATRLHPYGAITHYGLPFQTVLVYRACIHWPSPRSLVTTSGVSVDFLSSGYLDISVRRVCLLQSSMTQRVGFPHSEIHGSMPIRGSPWLIAAYYVLHRLSTPRHSPNALETLDRSYAKANAEHVGIR